MSVNRRIYTAPIAITLAISFAVPSQAADFTDTTPPRVTLEEVAGLNPNLNIILFKIQAGDSANKMSLQNCESGQTPPNCQKSGISTFLFLSQSPPANIAPACTTENLTKRRLRGYVIGTNSATLPSNDSYKFASTFYVAVTKTPFEKIPDGCPKWRDEGLQTISNSQYSNSKLMVIDEAGNSTEVQILAALTNADTLPSLNQEMCFLDSEPLNLALGLEMMNNQYEILLKRFGENAEFNNYLKNTIIEKYDEHLKKAKSYINVFKDQFSPDKLNTLPTCIAGGFFHGTDAAVKAIDITISIAELSIKISDVGASERLAQEEAEAKVAAIAKGKRPTIICFKGKLTKKVTAVNPKCPSGYKLKK